MYTGRHAVIPLGQMGLLTDLPTGEIPVGALIRANNISFETGSLTKAPGSLRYNTQVLPSPIVGLHDWWADTTTQQMIAVCANGSIYRDIGDRLFSSAVALNSGLMSLTPRCKFIEGGQETALRAKKLFLFTGANQLKVLSGDIAADGDGFQDVDDPAADWVTPNFPTCGVTHRNRLWAFMKQRAYASDSGNHEDFDTNNLTQAIFPGEGGDIQGAFVFKGRLFAFKEGGFVYYLDDADADSDNWVWRKLASNFGLSSPNGILEIMNDMIAVSESGSPTSYRAVDSFGDVESGDLLRMLQIENYYRNNVSLSGVDVCHAIYYEAKKQAFFTARNSYRTTNNVLLHLDFNKQQPRAALWSKDQADCLALRRDLNKIPRPIYGSADGYVYLMDREDRLVGGSAYTGEFKIGHVDFRHLDPAVAHKNKLFDFLAVEFKPKGTWNLSVDVFIDGTFSETISFSMDVRDDGLNAFTLGSGGGTGIKTPSGGDGDPLGREESQTIQAPLHGSGRQISFSCRLAGANQNFEISSFTVGFRVSETQASRA